jgi:hypothetical protein
MSDADTPAAPTPSFACLDAPPPPTLASDFEALLALTPSAKEHYGDLLARALEPDLGPDMDRALEEFARRHEVVPSRLALALRGSRFLLAEAARLAADRHQLAADLGRLVPGRAEELRAILLPLFDASMKKLRAAILRRTILDHGALLTGVDWRVDRILGSQHGRAIDAPLAVLTLTYRAGAEEKRVTLHCEPSMLQRLRAVCDAMIK